MSNRVCVARLRKELRSFEPPPYILAAPLEANIQEWHYVLQGPPSSPYEGGMYHGKIRFPDDFPFKPPSIYMLTPNGRFETDRRLCLSMSDFHPETWVPTWSVATILNGVLSFMLEDSPTTGAVVTSLATKHRLRDESAAFNDKGEVFRKLFPELVGGVLFTDTAPPANTESTDATADEQTASKTTSATAPCACDAGEDGEDGAEAGEQADNQARDKAAKQAARNRKKREKAAARKKQLAAEAVVANADEGVAGEP
mmetsp:Transcript_51984/g.119591  ORF Transcript_51984/g.119591 Transcript_51984/m.119591 type:complete len:256 (-) Transcript_51984:146-913(-)|eukprot:CAMPEP_0119377192 /NCGR_PEP_ID=MMETSP1334-20130426/43598_1 /TAXON_ID=127549 /ORGANISM="Calcidiscus leptoporus, Strain RCC1130" /LENGTH=255 /DNA_ID=CAMNT_0007396011 /DNA_START=101 /DNA_END=868 /DNA_ORIENTATION=+